MSISVPLAVTMMMGTCERARMVRHTSMPDILGSMRSSRRMSGVRLLEELQRLVAVAGHGDPEALVGQSDHQRLDEGLLVLGQQHLDRAFARGGRPPFFARLARRCLAHATRSAWIGRTSVKVEPSPSRDSTSTQP